MPVAWLYSQVDLAVAGLIAVLYLVSAIVYPLWRIWRIRCGATVDRYRSWFVAAHVVAVLALVTVVPGVEADSLGLGWRSGHNWPAALGLTALFLAVLLARAVYVYRTNKAEGRYLDQPMPDLPELAERVMACARDTLLFVAVPMFVGVGAFDLPLLWVAVAAMLGYGFRQLPAGPRAAFVWTGITGVALLVYLRSGHVVLPALIMVATAIVPEYTWPRGPTAPPPAPLLTVVEPMMPLR
jgi:hypothetical protein